MVYMDNDYQYIVDKDPNILCPTNVPYNKPISKEEAIKNLIEIGLLNPDGTQKDTICNGDFFGN